ncbi:hypothetical protein CC2G_008512 [Coprinopsis cinerea AmutBmut pab1-1]|nr:hypothetical protein CC2G_008512 [Coprinopsis cinerea AmutBmut pab1-1]
MATTLPATSSTSQNVVLPDIPELFNENFLDVLLPSQGEIRMETDSESPTIVETPKNALMEALKGTTNQTLTANLAPALRSTLSSTLDAFNQVDAHARGETIKDHLSKAWAEDPQLTLRIIWCLRSIPDGKGSKEGFYRAYAWLLDNHPRTAIVNLRLLVEPVSLKKKTNTSISHGYWKDLLNIVAIAACGDLSPDVIHPGFLYPPRQHWSYKRKKEQKTGTPEERIAAHLAKNVEKKEEAKVKRAEKLAQSHERLTARLADPKFRALYIAVARLFSSRLEQDMDILTKVASLPKGKSPVPLLKTMSLAGKWAPTPALAHDKVTNMSSAIALLLSRSQLSSHFPKALSDPSLPPRDKFLILRSFYQRWVLRPLREAIQCPEPLMSSNRWNEIRYTRVPSIAMKNNTEHFFRHDPDRFQEYLISVEKGKKSISGATLMPHELTSAIYHNGLLLRSDGSDSKPAKYPALQEFKKSLAETELRVAEAQWKTLIETLKANGKLDNCLAVCDVSGSMGSLHSKVSRTNPAPIHVAVALSLVLASLAKPPFNGGFITFSQNPQFVQLDLENKSLCETILEMERADWGMNTDLNAVFLRLLLPLAKKNNLKQEDMVKRLFIFSDMQFDEAGSQGYGNVMTAANWETNYDAIAKAYEEAGYEVPQIVYWDLNASGQKTVEVTAERKGVAMMNGFSPALLKVFMGEENDDEDAEDWEKVGKEGQEKEKEDEFNPLNVMKKALMRKSFEGLVVVD